jgi:Cu(I)/Ag(I) efflux system membrane fusion protein
MKLKTFLIIVIVAALAGAAGWYAGHRSLSHSHAPSGNGRKVLFYQSSMHPWIKSDKPGKCTICGMDLVPVYEGEKGFDVAEGLVTLSSNSINVINVQTDEVRRQPLRRTLRVAGTIEDDDTRRRILSAYVEGRIDKLFVNYVGAEVVEGQSLATIYSPMLLAAEREYALLALQKPAASALQTEHARLLESAAQRLKRLGLTDKQVAALPEQPSSEQHIEIVAPMTGTVLARNIYEGQYVKEGDKLFDLADFSKMWFRFDAYERDLPWLKVGQEVEVTVPAVPGKVYSAAITFIEPNLNDPTRSAKVRVELPNPVLEQDGKKKRELYHRLYAEAVVKIDVPQVLALARSAVLSPGAQPVVYVDKGGGTYEHRKVKLGRRGDELWEVLEGLGEGERVVTSGNLLIDAQAQLNQAVTGTDHQHDSAQPQPATTATDLPPLTDSQRKAVTEFLTFANALTAALSGDNLVEFNQQAARLHEKLSSLLNAFDKAAAWQPPISKIEAAAHLEKAANLKAARKEFHALTLPLVEFVQNLRAHESEFGSLKVYQCPMLKQAFPGAPSKGQWMQLQGPLRNPYFGAEMLDCGNEVKP